MLLCSLFVVPFVCFLAFSTPLAVLLGLVPLVIVLPTLSWLDRVEPEPRSAKVHALLWGATVAPLVAGIINTITASVGSEDLAAVVSAPVSEEGMKGLGVLWALKRFEINDTIDGIVFAGWIGLGFAVSEDFMYLANAAGEGQLLGVFLVRAILTPFAHPLFTAWTGLAVGLAVAKGRSPKVAALWGLGLAMATHAAWNGSLTWSQRRGSASILAVAIPLFVVLFVAAVVMCVVVRNRERQRFIQTAPAIAGQIGLSASEIAVFATWKGIRQMRKALPRSKRRSFDAFHSSLARLTSMHHRPAAAQAQNNTEQARHVENLQAARTRLTTEV